MTRLYQTKIAQTTQWCDQTGILCFIPSNRIQFLLSLPWPDTVSYICTWHVPLKRYYLLSDLRSSLLHLWSCHSTPAHPGWGLCWCKWCRRRSASLRLAGVERNSEVLQIDDSLERNRDKLFFPFFLAVFWLRFYGIWQHTVLFKELHVLILLHQQWVKCLCVISCL